MNITSKNRKKRLSEHGIEIDFFPIDLKFKGNFLCISETKICLNSVTVLTSNLSSSWFWLYFCIIFLCYAKSFEVLDTLPQVKQSMLFDNGVKGHVTDGM